MSMKSMVTKSLCVSMVGVVAVMSTANYKGNLKTTLESNLSDLETMLAGYSAKFKDQKRQIAQYVAQIGANETTIKNLQDQVKSLTADKTSLTSERNDLKSKLTSIATLLGIPTEGKDMDTLVADISNNITNGAEVSSDELATFKTIAKNLGKTEEEVASMSRNELVVFINAEVNSLNAELDEANAEIVEYEGKIESANTEIARLEGEVGKLQAEIKRLEGIIAQYEADLNALNSKAETIEETYKEEYNNEIKGENQGNVEGTDKAPEVIPGGGGTPEEPTEPEQPTDPVDPPVDDNNTETTKPVATALEQSIAKALKVDGITSISNEGTTTYYGKTFYIVASCNDGNAVGNSLVADGYKYETDYIFISGKLCVAKQFNVEVINSLLAEQ